MIKRPLLLVTVLYSAGILLADSTKAVFWVVSSAYAFLLFGILCFPVLRKHLQFFFRREKQAWLFCALPIVLLLGSFLTMLYCTPLPMEERLTAETKGTLHGTVTSVVQGKRSIQLTVADAAVLMDGSSYASRKILVYLDDGQEVKIGNVVQLQGSLSPFATSENPGQFDERKYYFAEGYSCKMFAERIIVLNSRIRPVSHFFSSLRQQLSGAFRVILPEQEAGILCALLLGEKASLSDTSKQMYQDGGIAHVLAISGLHISLIGMGLFLLLRRLKSPLLLAAAMTVLSIFAYGTMTNFSVSTKRAVWMLLIAMIARLFGRTYDSLSACCLCAIVILIRQPMQLFSPGFQLSFAAVVTISIVSRELRKRKKPQSNKIITAVIESFLCSLSIQVVTAPIVIYSYFQIPVYAPFVNLLILPLLSILVSIGLIAGFVGMVWIDGGMFLAGCEYFILKYFELLCEVTKRLPYHTVLVGRPSGIGIFLYYLLLVIGWKVILSLKKPVVNRTRKRCLVAAAAMVMPFCLLFGQRRRTGITMLSVGQGDCIFIQGKNSCYLVDGGSTDVSLVGKYRINPFLKSQGIDTLDAVFLSHSDADHVNGVAELISSLPDLPDYYRTNDRTAWYQKKLYCGNTRIRELILPAVSRNDKVFMELCALAFQKGIHVRYFSTGDCVIDDNFSISCIFPEKAVNDSSNANSMVLHVKYEQFDCLMTGDSGVEAEREIMDYIEQSSAMIDVLKVSHHGSKYETSDTFLRCLQPCLSLISSGRGNLYGHPHEELLQRLRKYSVRIGNTQENGAICITTDGEKLEMSFLRGK